MEIEIQSYIQCGGTNGPAQPWTVDEIGLASILDDATVALSQTLLGWATGRRSWSESRNGQKVGRWCDKEQQGVGSSA